MNSTTTNAVSGESIILDCENDYVMNESTIREAAEADSIRKPLFEYDNRLPQLVAQREYEQVIANQALSKSIARKLSREVLLPCKNDLYRERISLFEKETKKEITRSEKIRLTYLEWQLDRLEDALVGEELDGLEKMIEANATLAATIRSIVDQVKEAKPSAFKRRKTRG
jgi:hypothetical protein